MKRVLITNGDNIRALVFIRALAGKRDVELHVSAERKFAAGFYSKYCSHKLINVNPKKNLELFLKQLVNYVKVNNIDVLIPVNADELDLVLRNRSLFPKNVNIPFPDYEKFSFVKDKWNFFNFAKKLGVPVPETVKVTGTSGLGKVKIDFPLIVKIRTGAGSKGVKKVNNKAELLEVFDSISKEYKLSKETYPLIQEYIENGENYCASAFCRKGKVESVFVYKSLRQYPLDHGTSTSKVSVKDAEIDSYVRRMLEHLEWHGIAQFDLIKKNGKLYFLEMNPRLYTSLNTTVKGGLNYPYYLCLIDENISIPKSYRVGIGTRIILSDTLVFFKSLVRKKKYPLKEYLLCLRKNWYFDDVVVSDFLPSLPLFVKFIRGKLL